MKVCFHGFQENVASFEVSGTVSKGDPVKVSANGTVAACAAGERAAVVSAAAKNMPASLHFIVNHFLVTFCNQNSNRSKAKMQGVSFSLLFSFLGKPLDSG